MAPLSEVHNQVRPPRRPAVYGRRRGVLAETRDIHRQLFGTDENDLEKRLEKLTINAEPKAPPQPPPQVQPGPPEKLAPQQQKPGKRRRQPVRGRTWKMADLSEDEKKQLGDLLPLMESNQPVVDFEEYISARLNKFTVTKVGEGSFSEVYRLTDKQSPDISSVIKIIPFDFQSHDSAPAKSGEPPAQNSNLDDVAREVKVLKDLREQHGFTALRGFQPVRGKWHQELLTAFKNFKETSSDWSINDDPSSLYGHNGLYGVIEMDFAGTHIEELKNPSPYQVYDTFWQATILLAHAEMQLEFEHRDLHMSNVCFKCTETADNPNFSESDLVFGRSGLRITIIDYTYSRMKLKTGEIVYHPKSAASDGVNQPIDHQQRAVIRSRNYARALKNASGTDDNEFRAFAPKTNVIWLGHLLWELRRKGPSVKDAETAQDGALQREISRRLQAVEAVIDGEDMDSLPGSAQGLLEIGIERGWVAESDVVAFSECLNSESA